MVGRMGKNVQIRNMPQETHEILKARAARAGLSLSDYLLQELTKSAERPTREELIERIRSRGRGDLGPGGAAELVRTARREREAELEERWSSSTRPR